MKLFTKALAVTATLALAGTAMAANYSVDSTGPGVWSNTNSWLVGGVHPANVPTSSDNVTIDFNLTINAANAVARQITVNSGKTLTISGYSLTLSSVGSVTSTISGVIDLQSSSNLITSGNSLDHVDVANGGLLKMNGGTLTLAASKAVRGPSSGSTNFMEVAASSTINGASAAYSIQGRSDTQRIDFDPAVTLTLSTVMIEGQVKFQGPTSGTVPTFDNEGVVLANVSGGTILFDPYVALADNSTNAIRWEAVGQGTMEFDRAASGLRSAFYADGGANYSILHFVESVSTTGDAGLATHNKFIIDTGKSFTFGFGAVDDCNLLGTSPLTAGTYSCP